jgi:hypothetical protein
VDTKSAYTWLGSTSHDSKYVGAVLRVLDDRTDAERTNGTFPTGRIPEGTEVTVSASAYNFGTTTYRFTVGALPYAPQTGCQFAVYWKRRARIIDEVGTGEPATIKSLRSLRIRAKATANTTVNVKYEGDPTRWNPDQPVSDTEVNKSVVLSNATEGAFTDKKIPCGPSNNRGYKHLVMFDVTTGGKFVLNGVVYERSVVGK